MSENLKRCLKVSVIVVIALELIDIFVPTPVIEFLAYTIVTLCCIGFVILFFVILYGLVNDIRQLLNDFNSFPSGIADFFSSFFGCGRGLRENGFRLAVSFFGFGTYGFGGLDDL